MSNVIPLCPENIQNGDSSGKNDCERNAAKRFMENLLGDGITSNAPYIRLAEHNSVKYIFGAKPGNHKALFDAVEASEETKYHEILDDKGFLHQFRYLNDVALNKSNPDVRVNFLEYMQTDPKGKENRDCPRLSAYRMASISQCALSDFENRPLSKLALCRKIRHFLFSF